MKQKIINFFKKDKVQRVIRTFLQAFGGSIASVLVVIDWTDMSVAKTALFAGICAAFSAGLSAVMNLAKKKTEE